MPYLILSLRHSMATKVANKLLTFSSMHQMPAKYFSSLFLQYNPLQQYRDSTVCNTNWQGKKKRERGREVVTWGAELSSCVILFLETYPRGTATRRQLCRVVVGGIGLASARCDFQRKQGCS